MRVGAADFFTLGSRSKAALLAGPAAARLHPSYAAAAVEALVGAGVGGRGTAAAGSKALFTSTATSRGRLWHWERATRELSARALARVLRSAVECGWCEDEEEKNKNSHHLCPSPSSVAARLLEKCGVVVASSSSSSSCSSSSSIGEPEERHGALCALAEVLGEFREEEDGEEKKEEKTKKKNGGGAGNDVSKTSTSSSSTSISFLPLDDATLSATATLPSLSFQRLVRGRGGEMVREAAMRLISARARRAESASSSSSLPSPSSSALPWPSGTSAASLAAIDECLRHPSQAVRSSAADALGSLVGASAAAEAAEASPSSSPSSSDYSVLALVSADALPRWVRWLANDSSSGVTDGAARAGGAAALGALFGSSSKNNKNNDGQADALLLRALLLPAAPAALRALEAACRLEPDGRGGGSNRDAEARAAAARALPVVASRVFTPSSTPSSSFSSSSSSSLRESIEALLDASADYSTDKRGDVGSWVRGPGSKGATELLLLLLLVLLRKVEEEAEEEEEDDDDEEKEGERRAKDAREAKEKEAIRVLAPRVARALARQASERSGRLRGEARESLRLLLDAGARVAWEFLPDAAALAEAVRAADEVHASSVAAVAGSSENDGDDGGGGEEEEEEEGRGRGHNHSHHHHHHHSHHHHHHHHSHRGGTGDGDDPTLALATLLLRLPPYAPEAAAGLAACAGGLDAPLARAAGRALCSAAAAASDASAVARALVSAWSSSLARGEESRLGTPFLKAADALLSGIGGAGGSGGSEEGEGEIEELEPLCARCDPSDSSSPSLAQGMLDLSLQLCGPRCRDPARLCAASALLCHLAGVDGRRGRAGEEKTVVEHRATAARALRAAASLTGHPYPTVRRAAAENLSLRLLMGAPVVEDDEEEEGEDGDDDDEEQSENERARAAVWRESGKEKEGQERKRPDATAASDLLSETAWDGPTTAARAARERLLELLGLPPLVPVSSSGEAREGGGGGVSGMTTTTTVAAAAAAAAASSSGYQSLIDAVSRGGAD